MNKEDIRRERVTRVRELREWAQKLDACSPALAKYFRDQADYIESSERHYDSFGATMMVGRVLGMTDAASILYQEWLRHR